MEPETDGYARLWLAVIERAVKDTQGARVSATRIAWERSGSGVDYQAWRTHRLRHNARIENRRRDSLGWLTGDDDPSETFEIAAETLGVDPTRLRRGILRKIGVDDPATSRRP